MKAAWTMAAALAVALVAFSGCCQPAQHSRLGPERVASAALFGPLPLARGTEDRGYFATTVAGEEPLLLFNEQSSYVRTEVWDYENNFAPNTSIYQMWRHSVKEGPSNQ